MNKHCKGCVHHHSAGRTKQKDKTLGKYNDWCCKQGSPVNISHCKLHGMKQVKTT